MGLSMGSTLTLNRGRGAEGHWSENKACLLRMAMRMREYAVHADYAHICIYAGENLSTLSTLTSIGGGGGGSLVSR